MHLCLHWKLKNSPSQAEQGFSQAWPEDFIVWWKSGAFKIGCFFLNLKKVGRKLLKIEHAEMSTPQKKYCFASTCLRRNYFPQVFYMHRLNTYLVFCRVWRKTCFKGRFHLIYVTDTIVSNYHVHTCKHGTCLPEDNNHLSPPVFGSGAWEIGEKTHN